MGTMKHSICKICSSNYIRGNGLGKKICSEACKQKALLLIRCKPLCLESDLELIEVSFKDGTKHFKKICKVCRSSKGFVPKPRDVLNTKVTPKKERSVSIIEKRSKNLFGDTFYTSRKWLSVRYDFLINKSHECNLCGSIERPIHVDHIKPRSKYPELEFDLNNLQILCASCNIGKSNKG